jgi:mono/diheme cytochrome c family protein
VSAATKPSSRKPLLFGLTLVLAAGCGEVPGKPKEEDRPVRPDKELRFDVLFKERCAGCHGADGNRGPAPPLNDEVFLAIVKEDDLLKVITNGRAVNDEYRTPMPAFARSKGGPLTEDQVKVLAEGIKKKWGKGKTPTANPPPYLQPEGEKGDPAKGKELFARVCAGCHGENGDKPRLRLNDPAFLSLISDQALRRYVITGRHDLPDKMPNYQDQMTPLSPRDVSDLAAHLASWRQSGPKSGGAP